MTARTGQHRGPSGWRMHARVPVAGGLVAAVLLGVGPAGPGIDPPPAPAGLPPAGTITIHGPAGGFGAIGETVPSGQGLAKWPVPGWDLPPGFHAGATAVAADGTVFLAGAGSAVAAYQPAARAFATIPLAAQALTPVAGGEAVAFTSAPAAGDGPVLGVLTRVAGEWAVAAQWRAADLELATPSLGELVSLPGSGHVIAIQPGGTLLALRVAGPDPDGRFTAAVAGRFQYPEVRDPVTGDPLNIGLRHLRADPTGEPGDERFVVVLEDLGDREDARPLVLQEFRYDAGEGALAPVSAPTVPGDQRGGGEAYGYAAAAYDGAGNLWAARHYRLAGGSLAVYAGTAGRPALAGPDCPFDPAAPPGSYRSGEAGEVWGLACPPAYDLLQAQHMGPIIQLGGDPAGDRMVGVTLGGALLAVRAARDRAGSGLTFEVGNLVDPGLSLLSADVDQVPAGVAFGTGGHFWVPVSALPPASGQWLYEVDVAELFEPAPVRLPEVPGQSVTIQAGQTVTTGTEQLEGSSPTVEVNSRAYMLGCTNLQVHVGCNHDGVPGNGFILGERHGYGHLAGDVDYRVEVPVAGRYRVTYRVFTFPAVEGAEITLTAGGETHRMPVDTGGQWRNVPGPELSALPAGVQTVRLSVSRGRGGWHLSWLSLQRA